MRTVALILDDVLPLQLSGAFLVPLYYVGKIQGKKLYVQARYQREVPLFLEISSKIDFF